jgi:hypothetical protein
LWFIGNNFTDGFSNGQRASKKLYPFHSIGISIAEYKHITDKKTICHSIGDFFVR